MNMQTRKIARAASNLALAVSLTLAGASVGAQDTKAEDHTAHHPAGAASAPKQAPKSAPTKTLPATMDKGNMEKMGQMDSQMKAMKDMHQKFMAAKTPEERSALMPAHMKAMQDTMATMQGMGGMGMMGGKEKNMMMDKMPADMMGMHQMMEKRMDMMQSMMQMMMDRMQSPMAPTAK